MNKKTIKSAFESMMFVWGEPLKAKDAGDIFNISQKEAVECFRELQEEYEQEGRGIVIKEVNGAFQFVTREVNADYIEKLCTPVKAKRLSQSALEVLAIIAYRQPVTKGEIEAIRGIKCDRVIDGLTAKGLVKIIGRSEAVGRPNLYGTTDEFLANFGFKSIKDLPEIDDIESAISIDYDQIEGEISDGQIAIDFEAATGAVEKVEENNENQ